MGNPDRPIFINKINRIYVLSQNAEKGSKILYLKSTQGLKSGLFPIRHSSIDSDENIYIEDIHADHVTLLYGISEDYEVNSTITDESPAGIRTGNDYAFFTNSGNEMYSTAIHEILHLPDVAAFADVLEEDNIMYYKLNTNVAYKRIRYRPVKCAYNDCIGPEMQWQLVRR